MSKRKKLAATSDQVHEALGVIDKALRATGRMLSADEDDIRRSEADIDLESVDLPEALRDPMKTLEHGRHVLKHGFSVPGNGGPPSNKTRQHLAQAARNGRAISSDLQERMHRDREKARDKKKQA